MTGHKLSHSDARGSRDGAFYNRAMVLRALFLPLLAALSMAQTAAPPVPAPQPPAEVDRALRARVTAFYDLMVAHQYRKAEELIAFDSRDIYYEREKPRYLKFEITSVKYSEEFTRADVVVTARLPVVGGLILTPMDMAVPSIWRMQDGAWYWSIPKMDVLDMVRSLAGGKPSSPDTPAAAAAAPPPGNAALPGTMPSNPNLPAGMGRPESIPIMGAGETASPQFSLDREQAILKPKSVEKVTITNRGTGTMTLFLLGDVPGIEATFDRTSLKAGEKAVLSIHANAGAKDGTLLIGVTETRAMISLPVAIKRD